MEESDEYKKFTTNSFFLASFFCWKFIDFILFVLTVKFMVPRQTGIKRNAVLPDSSKTGNATTLRLLRTSTTAEVGSDNEHDWWGSWVMEKMEARVVMSQKSYCRGKFLGKFIYT